ncbi:MAG: sulfotransferase [Candidatus Eremiobacteraeota bacterium]|nr:sulfotransferase [Candidatus Eremiobacteraeota bacterium]
MSLERYRSEIDELDDAIVRALARRFAVCRDVAELKARTGTPMMQPQRVGAVKRRAAELGERYGLERDLVERMYDLLIQETCRLEDALIAERRDGQPCAPVLVGGDHRSGTTLVSVILDSHPELVMGPELDFLEPTDLGPHLCECCRLLLADDPRVRGAGVGARDPQYAAGVQLAKQSLRFGVPYDVLLELAEAAMRRTGSDLRRFDERLVLIDAIGRYRAAATRKPRWGIKIQREIAQAGRFAAHWPGARFVHVVRDGRDVAASHLRGGRPWGYRSIEEAASGWAGVVDAAARTVAPDDIFELRYEDLVADPPGALRPLFAFLGLGWDPRVLHHDGVEHSLFANPFEHPSADAARRPIDAQAVGRHRRDLSDGDVAAFERLAGDALRRHGYAQAVRA